MVILKKINNKGFVMTETLIVAVFIMAVFAIMYNNYYPLIGEYERREVFDDIDSKYAAFWIKRFIQHDSFILTPEMIMQIENNAYTMVDCNDIDPDLDDYRRTMCNRLIRELQVMGADSTPHIYMTKYNLVDFKEKVKTDVDYATFSGGLQDYVNFLPEYSKISSLNFASYRIIVEFDRRKNGTEYYAYSTIEVKK